MTNKTNKLDQDFSIVTQYVKDISFEAPNSPSIFFQKIEEKPAIEVNVDIKASKVNTDLFNIELSVKAQHKVGDKTLFLIELVYGTVIKINTEDKETEEKILLIEAPKMIFPFIRSIISDITKDSGFPPLVLAPIDFAGLYANKQKSKNKH